MRMTLRDKKTLLIVLLIAVVAIIGIVTTIVICNSKKKEGHMKKSIENYIKDSAMLTPEEVVLNHFKFRNERNIDLLRLTLAENQRKVIIDVKNIKRVEINSIENITGDETKLKSGGEIKENFNAYEVEYFDVEYEISYKKVTYQSSGVYLWRFAVARESKDAKWLICSWWDPRV